MKVMKQLQQIPASDLAEYILSKYGEMSFLKLSSLLYYCEAYHLAKFDAMLIHEAFKAWLHIPIITEILPGGLEDNQYADVVATEDVSLYDKLSIEQLSLVEEVLTNLITWTHSELETAYHRELPYQKTVRGEVISKVTMMHYYKAELYDQQSDDKRS